MYTGLEERINLIKQSAEALAMRGYDSVLLEDIATISEIYDRNMVRAAHFRKLMKQFPSTHGYKVNENRCIRVERNLNEANKILKTLFGFNMTTPENKKEHLSASQIGGKNESCPKPETKKRRRGSRKSTYKRRVRS